MRKVLYVLLASMLLGFASCSSDDKEDDITPPEPEYFNPVEGAWIWDKNDEIRYTYTKEFKWVVEWYEKNEWGHPEDRGTYTINKEYIKNKGITYKYIISDDILTLHTSGGAMNFTRYTE